MRFPQLACPGASGWSSAREAYQMNPRNRQSRSGFAATQAMRPRTARSDSLPDVAVALGRHRLDEARRAPPLAELDSEVAYVPVDDVACNGAALSPDVREDRLAREHLVRMSEEQVQQCLLQRGQPESRAVQA